MTSDTAPASSVPASSSASAATFRSILPHEPPPQDVLGHVHLQGAFAPKLRKSKNDKQEGGAQDVKNNNDNDEKEDTTHFWTTREGLHRALVERLAWTLTDDHPNLTTSDHNNNPLTLPHAAQEVQVLDAAPPFTKVRLTYASPQAAQAVVAHARRQGLSPRVLFENDNPSDNTTTNNDDSNTAFQFGTRPLLWTCLTQRPLPTPSWTRSNPPKFRRLLPRPNEDPAALEQERQTTRFLYVTNLLIQQQQQDDNGNDTESMHNLWSSAATEAVRSVFDAYDSTGQGVEVFTTTKKMHQYCHVGMRTAADAQRAIRELQEQTVTWNVTRQQQQQEPTNDDGPVLQIPSGPLFLDYAAITSRSNRQVELRAQGKELEKGEPSRPECTSTTAHVEVPGLMVLPDFVTADQEASLLAVLLGPQAPWAPSQSTPTEGGIVKRRVQHYGYVFDYETADVLRDRGGDDNNNEGSASSNIAAQCPPLPVLNEENDGRLNNPQQVEECLQAAVREGRGWNVLAGVIERVRQTRYSGQNDNDADDDSATPDFPNINQLTVNHYAPGEGIGSHVDTPSAFGDGLLSLSLSSGLVMEFREVSGEKKKKHVYLPPRSLVAMTGPARYQWEHMIVTRRTDHVEGKVLPRQVRVSLTFRTALALDGSALPRVVASRTPPVWGGRAEAPEHSNNFASTPDCERDHVHAVYDAIATQWHHTRGKRGVLWPGATQFLERLPRGSIVADVGCGDGKYFPAILEAGSYVIGTDISRPLLETSFGSSSSSSGDKANIPESRRVSASRQALADRPAVAVADCMSVPLLTESCDAAICIAVLHHLSNRERRLRCIRELARVVKPGGVMNIQAWALDQANDSKRRFAAEDVYVPFNAQPKYLQLPSNNKPDSGSSAQEAENQTQKSDRSTAQVYADAFDGANYDDRKGLVVFQRYCHLYREGELEELVAEVPEVELVESGFESGNYFVIIQKR